MDYKIEAREAEKGKYYELYQDGERQIVHQLYTPEDGGYYYWGYITTMYNNDYSFYFCGEKLEIEKNVIAI